MSAHHPPTGTRLVVLPNQDGARLDIFLAEATSLSRRAARRLISDGPVSRNGVPLRVQSRVVETGDVIDVLLPPAELGVAAQPTFQPLQILHQDRWLLAAGKPSGVLTAPAEKMGDNELAFDQNVLLSLALEEGRRPYLRLLHRLDRVTSGAVLFARNSDVLPALTRAWSEGMVERVYLAVVEGVPSDNDAVIEKPIARDRSHNWRFMIEAGGRAARTEVDKVVPLDDNLALVRCRLITGRTHQVRVHLAAVGHPVLGDRLYGSKRAGEVNRPLLHAASIALPHPLTGDTLRIECPPPADLARFLPDQSNH